MRVIKANLPEGVKKQFGYVRGVKTKFVSKNLKNKKKASK